MKSIIKKTCLALTVSFGAVLVNAEPITVYGFELKNRMSIEGTEQYDLLWKNMKEAGLEVDLKIVSFSRYLKNFAENKDSCIFPTSIRGVTKAVATLSPEDLIQGEIVDHTGLAIFTKKEGVIINSMEDLNGKKLSMWNGLPPESFLPNIKYQSLERVANDEIQVRMLDRGKVEVAIGFVPDMFLAAEKLNIEIPKASKHWIIPRSPNAGASLVCHKSEAGQKLITQFNENLANIKESGELRKIMGGFADISDGAILPYD